MSPYLFIVYIDELSNMLNSAGIGCHIHNYCTNHVFYADDICVIAPSPIGLQGLLNICAKLGLVNDVERPKFRFYEQLHIFICNNFVVNVS